MLTRPMLAGLAGILELGSRHALLPLQRKDPEPRETPNAGRGK